MIRSHSFLSSFWRAPALAAACGAMATGFTLSAAAETTASAPPERPGRYTMSPVDGGFLRLDTDTGSVTFCSGTGAQWACSPVADNGKGPATGPGEDVKKLQNEAAKLKEENRILREALTLDPPVTTPGAPSGEPAPTGTLPTEQDVDKAFDYVEGMFKKFRERLKRLDEETKPVPKTGTL